MLFNVTFAGGQIECGSYRVNDGFLLGYVVATVSIKDVLGYAVGVNPRTPKVKIHLQTTKGGWVPPPPWILVFP